jgi:hypothetical protein
MTETQTPAPVWEPKLLEPRSACSSCIDTLDDLDWVASSTFRVGQWALGVRSSSVETDAALQRVLRAHLVDVDAPANFSLLMADDDTRTFNFLYRASDALVRTRAPGRLLRTLVSHLSEFVERSSAVARLSVTGLLVGGRVIVAPDALRDEIANIETRLNVAGIRVIDAPILELERGTGHVIVPEPALSLDTDALADYERDHPSSGRELAPVLAGRYPIAAWALTTSENRLGPIGAAQGVAAAAQQVVNADRLGAQQALDVVADALTTVPIAGIWWRESAELVGQLVDLGNER